MDSSSRKPMPNTPANSGAPTTPTTVVTSSANPSEPATLSMNCLTTSCGSFLRFSDRTGTNAWENAPSANSRRRKFGIRNATKKASAAALSPNRAANTVSRTMPNTRDSRVEPEVTIDDFSKPLGAELFGSDPGSDGGGDCIDRWKTREFSTCYWQLHQHASCVDGVSGLTFDPPESIVLAFFRVAKNGPKTMNPTPFIHFR